ncbi:NAD-dependent epimerase/dehydratase family protein [Elizabethkingia anophelis]|uniref:NAD-dependent epimerase/dehydratase family protein n=3 Tax=Elizabethkingia anophelis TaxID=1117645 RepID=UPI0007513573|nr:NAD-dependent epimerase/dehydratase family protein [Elizabethkingia anophelis]AQW91227.1 nucleoside-diphosphate-sugar epimerase [Elizabethkingia anophelis]KUY14093.1 dehydratase [Elizabethkingia anophelis]MCT3726502.1 NAD-dependent epimerase/dehydratase family protein [Elizabethkingia anophelis]MCT4237369.1 NAD-dependent epimerase/dehydratase family protein [Elizabethkingia anophelis]MCT4318633.1 NAD-dependent epimerase/dehydratase family protein [Elizabethkingia anophelis]
MDIIISGSSGFVGQNLSQYLENKNIMVHSISLRNENWKSDFDKTGVAIIHLAGKAHDTSNTSAVEEYFKINRDLTIQLFNEFLKSDIRDFIYFSSVKAVADTVEGILVEETEANPLTPYGKSKLEAEDFLLSQILPADKRLFIIRPCMIHGPGNKGNLNLLYKVVEKGLPWPLASFNNKRSFLSIDNLSFLINQILINDQIESGIYNFSDDDSLSTNDLIEVISESLSRKPKFLFIKKSLMESIAKFGDKLHIPLNTERLKKLTENYIVSNYKIKTALGIDKLPLTAKEGLKITIESFKNKN